MEEHPEEELNLYPNSQSSTIQSPLHNPSTPPPPQQSQQMSQLLFQNSSNQSQNSPLKQIKDDRLAAIQEMREKPLTLHNMKSLANPSAKTEALIATLAMKSNQNDFKNRIHKKTYMKKPLKKRLKGNCHSFIPLSLSKLL